MSFCIQCNLNIDDSFIATGCAQQFCILRETQSQTIQPSPASLIPSPIHTPQPDPVTLGSLVLARPTMQPGHVPQPMVPSQYSAGKHGVDALVTYSGRDAEIMNKMIQVSDILQAMAAELNQFTGVMASTRELIRSCRNLSNELQEEIEIRKGPQG